MIFKHKYAYLANIFIFLSLVHCRNIEKVPKKSNYIENAKGNLLFSGSRELQSLDHNLNARANKKESSTSEFIRLVTMRLIYGLAATMGVEDRLENIFNGAFVPPNAHEDGFGLDGLDDYADGDDDYSDPSSLFRDVIEDAF